MWIRFYRLFDRFLEALRILALVSILLLLGAGGYHLLSRPAPETSRSDSALSGEDGVKTKITGFSMTEKAGNDDRWTLNAQEVWVTEATTDMDGVKMHFAHPQKKDTTFDVASKKASMDNRTKNITFSGDVWVKMPRPLTLHTEKLDWISAKRTITTDDAIRIETTSGVVNGKGLIVELDEQRFTVAHSVRALFY